MKHLRVTVRPTEREIHPVHTLMTERECVENVRMLHWNLSDEGTPTILFHVEGDREEFSRLLESVPEVRAFSVTAIDDGRFYLHTRGEATDVELSLYNAFTLEGLLVLPPLEYTENGGVNFGVVGEPDELRAAVSTAPNGVEVTVERVGEYGSRHETVASVLTERQLEAVTTAREIGYYDTPREATVEDVAERMGCARSTAAEHLQKAESRIVSTLL